MGKWTHTCAHGPVESCAACRIEELEAENQRLGTPREMPQGAVMITDINSPMTFWWCLGVVSAVVDRETERQEVIDHVKNDPEQKGRVYLTYARDGLKRLNEILEA